MLTGLGGNGAEKTFQLLYHCLQAVQAPVELRLVEHLFDVAMASVGLHGFAAVAPVL